MIWRETRFPAGSQTNALPSKFGGELLTAIDRRPAGRRDALELPLKIHVFGVAAVDAGIHAAWERRVRRDRDIHPRRDW